MKLTLKFAIVFLLGLSIVFAMYAWLTVRRETDLFLSDMERDNLLVGQVVAAAVDSLGARSSSLTTHDFLKNFERSGSHVHVRWVDVSASANHADVPWLRGAEREALVQGQQIALTEQSLAGGSGEFITYVPTHVGAGGGAIEVRESLDDLHEYTHQTLIRIATTTGAAIVACGCLFALVGTSMVGRPVNRLVESFGQVANGDLTHRPEVSQRDELGELAREFGTMCDRLAEARKREAAQAAQRQAATEQLRHADRLRTVGQLTAGVAHELGTPLNVVWARASMIARGEAVGEEAKVCASVIEDQSQRMTRIIKKLLEFSRPRPPQKGRVDLHQLIQQTSDVLAVTARRRGITLVHDQENEPAEARVDEGQIQQVLSNLMLNAIQAMSNGGELTVGVKAQRVRPPADVGGPEDEYLCLWVQDQGPGISKEDLPKIFEPFFTTKEIGEGTGLGLSISRGIIREHGGWIDVASSPGEGARFDVYLPREPLACAVAS